MSILVVQPDWPQGLSHNEKVWAYHKVLGQISTNGFLEDDNFTIVAKRGRTLIMKYSITNQLVLYVSPITVYDGFRSKSVLSLDIDSSGELAVSASADNKILLWEPDTGKIKTHLTGHLFDVTSAKFFPSSNLILSAGADMQIKIWNSFTKECTLNMTGHTGAVTDTAIVEKGDNIISVSRDGSARLWNVAQTKCIAELLQTESAINCCALTTAQNDMELPFCERDEDELETGTKSKLLAVGGEDGKITILELFSRQILAAFSSPCAVTCLHWSSWALLFVGLENGSVLTVDSKNLDKSPVLLSHDSTSSVVSICPLEDGVIVGRKDGICQYYTKNGINTVQLSGPDCDPVYSIVHHSRYVYTTCRDHLVRKYAISDVTSHM